MSRPWHFRGVGRRIDGGVASGSAAHLTEDVADHIDVEPPNDVVEATIADVTNLQMVAASWLLRCLDRHIEEEAEQFVLQSTVAISAGGATVCAEAMSLPREWQRLRELVGGASGSSIVDKEGDAADDMQDKEASADDMQDEEGDAIMTAEKEAEEKQPLQATQRAERATRREQKKKMERKRKKGIVMRLLVRQQKGFAVRLLRLRIGIC